VEVSFKKRDFTCLEQVLSQVQNMEQTQEIRIPEGMPEMGRILCCWGQPVLRGKEWRRDEVSLSAGMTVWVLYLPEEGGSAQCIQSWLPFQFRWDIPEDCAEGTARMLCLTRSVDARLVSAGKISVRGCLSALAEIWCPVTRQVSQPENVPEDLELLQRDYPLRLPKEAGEKTFRMEENLTLPGSAPRVERLIWFRMDPQVTDSRILGGKLVFRGNGNGRMLYEAPDGQLHSWEFELPFSQYAELKDSYGADAQASVIPAVTGLEAELGEEGIQLRAELTGQYMVDDRTMLTLPEDAYIPGGELTMQREMVEIPALLDSRRENIYGEQTIPLEGDLVVDATLLPDFPRQRGSGEDMVMELPGNLQMLYYDTEGQLQSSTQRWENSYPLPLDDTAVLSALPSGGIQTRATTGNGEMTVKTTQPMDMTTMSGQGLPVITSLTMPERREPDPARPSLILRRAEGSLWETAKQSGSTVDAIRQANGLEKEPVPGQMLLIPVI